MPKSLVKVQKKLAKKKGSSNSLHENSRDAQRLRRAGARAEKLDKLAAARAKANQPHCPGTPCQITMYCEILIFPSKKSSLFPGSSKGSSGTLRSGEDSRPHSEVLLQHCLG